MYTCVGRMDQESSGVAHTSFLEGQQPVLQDYYTYSTVDDMQQEMPAVLGYPAYEFVPELTEQPLQEDDQTYSNVDQQETVKSSEHPKHGTALTAAASAK